MDLLVNKHDRHYKRALRREIIVWRSNNKKADLNTIEFLPHKFIFQHKQIEISTNHDWLDFIGYLKNFKKGLILGGGNAEFEKYLLEKGIVKTFENFDIIFDDKQPNGKLNIFAELNF